MVKIVTYVDVYQSTIQIRLENNLPVGLDIMYGLVDDTGVKWTPKLCSTQYVDLNTVQKNRVDNLIASGANITKAREGL
jgi:hypothetical protein